MPTTITETSDTSFQADVLDPAGLVVVDFWATWCGPCHTLAPLIGELADDYAGDVLFTKIDADANPVTGQRFAVRGLPTLMLFRDGVEVDRLVGAVTKSRIAAMIDAQLDA